MISGSRMGYARCVLPYRNNFIVALGKYELVGSFIHIGLTPYYPKKRRSQLLNIAKI
jgi:hypothetical protein